MSDKPIDLNEWSQSDEKVKIALPYIKIENPSEQVLLTVSKIVSLLPDIVNKPMYVYITKGKDTYLLSQVEFSFNSISKFFIISKDLKVNINGDEFTASSIQEVYNYYGCMSNTNSPTNNDASQQVRDVTKESEFECIFN